MPITALVPTIGYARAAAIVHAAEASGSTLREAALAAGVDPATFDRLTDPATLARPSR
jgi:fumarate hydratase class II